MFCTNCGKEIADDAAFCSHCGQPVNAEHAAAVRATGNAQKKAKRGGKKKILIPLLALFLIAAGIAVFIFLRRPGSGSSAEKFPPLKAQGFLYDTGDGYTFHQDGKSIYIGEDYMPWSYADFMSSLDGTTAFVASAEYDRDGYGTLYVWQIRNGEKTEVLRVGEREGDIRFIRNSMDGSAVVYALEGRNGTEWYWWKAGEVRRLNIDENATVYYESALSPDGMHILYCVYGEGGNRLMVHDVGSNTSRPLTNASAPGDQIPLYISENGGYIYYYTRERYDEMNVSGAGLCGAYCIRDGKEQLLAEFESDYYNAEFFFNLDASEIIFGGENDLYLSRNGERASALPGVRYRPVLPDTAQVWHHPDGNGIAVIGTEHFSDTFYSDWYYILERESGVLNESAVYMFGSDYSDGLYHILEDYSVTRVQNVETHDAFRLCRDGRTVVIWNGDLYRLDIQDGKENKIKVNQGNPGEAVVSFTASDQGDVWYMTAQGKLCYSGRNAATEPIADNLGSDDQRIPYMTFFSKTETVFLINNGRLCAIRNKHDFSYVEEITDDVMGVYANHLFVYAETIDRNGNISVLISTDGEHFETLTDKAGYGLFYY